MRNYYHLGLGVPTGKARYHIGAATLAGPGDSTRNPGMPAPGPSKGGRDKALVALNLFMAEAGHPRWFGYALKKDGKTEDVERFAQDTDVADWYGAVTDKPDTAYATYFDTAASTVEPAEEFAGTITLHPEPAAKGRQPQGPATGKVAIGAGLALGLTALIATAKHR